MSWHRTGAGETRGPLLFSTLHWQIDNAQCPLVSVTLPPSGFLSHLYLTAFTATSMPMITSAFLSPAQTAPQAPACPTQLLTEHVSLQAPHTPKPGPSPSPAPTCSLHPTASPSSGRGNSHQANHLGVTPASPFPSEHTCQSHRLYCQWTESQHFPAPAGLPALPLWFSEVVGSIILCTALCLSPPAGT